MYLLGPKLKKCIRSEKESRLSSRQAVKGFLVVRQKLATSTPQEPGKQVSVLQNEILSFSSFDSGKGCIWLSIGR